MSIRTPKRRYGVAVPPPFRVGQLFETPAHLSVAAAVWSIVAVSGRGRNRAAKVAKYACGDRVSVEWVKIGRLRGDLDRAKASVLDGPCCRVCGCTEDNCEHCVERSGHPCHWIEPDLCSACQQLIELEKHVGGEARRANVKRDANPHPYHDDVKNDLRVAWDLGWCDNHNANALKSLGAFTGAIRKHFGGTNGQ